MDKITFLPRLQRERDKFENLLNRVGFSRQMTMIGVFGIFSIKDMLADILTREQFIADRLSEVLHHEIYSPCTSHTALENFQFENSPMPCEMCRENKLRDVKLRLSGRR